MRLSTRFISVVIVISFLCGCTTINNPATGRKERLLFNTSHEINLGRSVAEEIENSKDYKISKDPLLNQRLQEIGKKVSAVSDRTDLKYQFKVIDTDKLNAFALPGGFIYANSGLMEKLTDDELACVLAHEVGHIAARHGIKRFQSSLGAMLVVVGIGAAVDAGTKDDAKAETSVKLMSVVYNIIALGYSRQDERQADMLAVRYAYRCGVNPEALISMFEKLAKEQKNQYHIALLSSHPELKERIENVRKEIESTKLAKAELAVANFKR